MMGKLIQGGDCVSLFGVVVWQRAVDADHVAGILVEAIVAPALVVTFLFFLAQRLHLDIHRRAAFPCTNTIALLFLPHSYCVCYCFYRTVTVYVTVSTAQLLCVCDCLYRTVAVYALLFLPHSYCVCVTVSTAQLLCVCVCDCLYRTVTVYALLFLPHRYCVCGTVSTAQLLCMRYCFYRIVSLCV